MRSSLLYPLSHVSRELKSLVTLLHRPPLLPHVDELDNLEVVGTGRSQNLLLAAGPAVVLLGGDLDFETRALLGDNLETGQV